MECLHETKNGRCGLRGCYAYKHKCYTKEFCKCWEIPAPTIDPVHAAGACYCVECKHWANGLTEKRPCHRTGAYPMVATDFCSYGEPKENDAFKRSEEKSIEGR